MNFDRIRAIKSPSVRYRAATKAQQRRQGEIDELGVIRSEAIREMFNSGLKYKKIQAETGLSSARLYDLANIDR